MKKAKASKIKIKCLIRTDALNPKLVRKIQLAAASSPALYKEKLCLKRKKIHKKNLQIFSNRQTKAIIEMYQSTHIGPSINESEMISAENIPDQRQKYCAFRLLCQFDIYFAKYIPPLSFIDRQDQLDNNLEDKI